MSAPFTSQRKPCSRRIEAWVLTGRVRQPRVAPPYAIGIDLAVRQRHVVRAAEVHREALADLGWTTASGSQPTASGGMEPVR